MKPSKWKENPVQCYSSKPCKQTTNRKSCSPPWWRSIRSWLSELPTRINRNNKSRGLQSSNKCELIVEITFWRCWASSIIINVAAVSSDSMEHKKRRFNYSFIPQQTRMNNALSCGSQFISWNSLFCIEITSPEKLILHSVELPLELSW